MFEVVIVVVIVIPVVVAVVVVELDSWTAETTSLHLSGGCGRLLEGISFYSLLTISVSMLFPSCKGG